MHVFYDTPITLAAMSDAAYMCVCAPAVAADASLSLSLSVEAGKPPVSLERKTAREEATAAADVIAAALLHFPRRQIQLDSKSWTIIAGRREPRRLHRHNKSPTPV